MKSFCPLFIQLLFFFVKIILNLPIQLSTHIKKKKLRHFTRCINIIVAFLRVVIKSITNWDNCRLHAKEINKTSKIESCCKKYGFNVLF